MALLLRMGGVPARVSTGFTSGALDRRANEYVVRDLDAHSWVEVWYSGIGWVTFDPTPAAAPPRNQPDEATGTGPSGRPASAPLLPGDKGGTRLQQAAVAEAAPWWRIPLLVVVGVLLVGAVGWAIWRIRRPAPPAVDELERALRRTGRRGGPGTTLQRAGVGLRPHPGGRGLHPRDPGRPLRRPHRVADAPAAPRPAHRARPRPRGRRPPARVVGAAASMRSSTPFTMGLHG